MDAAGAIDMVKMFRGITLSTLEGLSDEQWLAIPDKFGNNILWNAGHILYYTHVFLYGPSGKDIPLPAEYGDLFKAGSSPSDWKANPDSGEVLDRLKNSTDAIAKDCASGVFADHKGMELFGTKLETIPQVMTFHCAHEGVHVGRITSLKKLI